MSKLTRSNGYKLAWGRKVTVQVTTNKKAMKSIHKAIKAAKGKDNG